MLSEEICGVFGSFDEQAFAYQLTRIFWAYVWVFDDVRSASLFVGFRYLLMLKHIKQNKISHLNRWDDVQRFERQGHTAMCFNLRV